LAEYRAYLIGDDGHFFDAFPLICADDAEAIEMAKKLVIDRDVELWQLEPEDWHVQPQEKMTH
jgi:hypothetical protein